MGEALRFLTVLPAPRGWGDQGPSAGSLVAFPAVGALIGLAWYATALASGGLWSYAVAAILILILDAVLTGGLHLDAFADVADGVASRKPADEAIQIMRQPAVGALGAAALVLITLLRFGWLVMLIPMPALVAAPIAGRLAMVVALWRLPARAGGSLAAAFSPAAGSVLLSATGVALALSLVAALLPGNELPLAGPLALAVGAAAAIGFTGWWRRRFGALIGDAVGACGLLAETLALGAITLVVG